jgi:hypothetical protein
MAVGHGKPVANAAAVGHIRAWLDDFVIGLNLCPFALPLQNADNLRIAICPDQSTAELRRAFLCELDLLQKSTEAEVATTLLAFSAALEDFGDYLDFLEQAQALLEDAGLEGLVQLASFHPHYQFAGEHALAASHYSNRSPYPLIHFLREDMLTRVLMEDADPDAIPARNVAKLETLGPDELERRWRALFDSDEPAVKAP